MKHTKEELETRFKDNRPNIVELDEEVFVITTGVRKAPREVEDALFDYYEGKHNIDRLKKIIKNYVEFSKSEDMTVSQFIEKISNEDLEVKKVISIKD